MPKYFLYIDESKDFKNHTLYLGGLVSKLGMGLLENFCAGCAARVGDHELKSTQDYDREFFETLIQENVPFDVFVEKIHSHSDKEYLTNLLEFIESFLSSYKDAIALGIFADFTRLGGETRKVETAFSQKLSHQFGIPIAFAFKNSSRTRTIQFADLAVGSFRRQKKAPAFDVSTSKSKTSLRIHSGGASGTV